MRLVVDLIRGEDVNDAYCDPPVLEEKGLGGSIDKVLRSAVANATYRADEAGETLDVDDPVRQRSVRGRGSDATSLATARLWAGDACSQA